MSSIQRLAAIGTSCRRPSALLLPLAPLVILVFLGLSIVSSLDAALTRRAARRPSVDEAAEVAEAATASRGITPRGISALRPKPRNAVGVAFALFGGILIAASMAGGTYAFLNAQAKTSAVNVSSGNLAVTVQYGSTAAAATAAIPAAAWSNMLPGDFVGQQITLANSGTVGTTISARLAATSAWEIRIVAGTCPATQLTSAPLTVTASAYSTLSAGTSSVVCVQATLPAATAASTESTSTQAVSAPFVITFDAQQVGP